MRWILPRGDETVQERVPIVKSAELDGISDYKHTHLHLHIHLCLQCKLYFLISAIKKDGCDVRGYFAWSLIDNFEWVFGYSMHFGLHQVDFTDPDRPRTPKASAGYYRSIVKNKGFRNLHKLWESLLRFNHKTKMLSDIWRSLGYLTDVIWSIYPKNMCMD